MAIKDIKTRIEWLDLLIAGKISRSETADRLEISTKQVTRLLQRYLRSGMSSMHHQLENRPSNHRHDSAFKEKVLDLIRNKYWDTRFFSQIQDCFRKSKAGQVDGYGLIHRLRS